MWVEKVEMIYTCTREKDSDSHRSCQAWKARSKAYPNIEDLLLEIRDEGWPLCPCCGRKSSFLLLHTLG